MLRIKRLDRFMLQSFLPLFVMTFFICLFIVLMQFLWRYIDDLVGKGLSIGIVSELFFYAALTMIPMALPLAVLLASLMIFGNLGERFELTAMKAAGVSLVRAMAPLTWLMIFIGIAAFFFQNDVLPVAQTKMWTLIYSVRQKSPEVEIPEGVFYDQIPGYNIFVKKKNPENGMLYDLMIYNMSQGFENATTILADSGRLAFTDDKTHLYLHLWNGESFENLRQAAAGQSNVPYRRESFDEKELLMKFDANFNRLDEEGIRSQYVGKNITQLQSTIDSVSEIIDSLGTLYGNELRTAPLFSGTSLKSRPTGDSINGQPVLYYYYPEVAMNRPLDVDSILNGSNTSLRLNYLNTAKARAQRQKQEIEFKNFPLAEEKKTVRRHGIEMHKKFTLSFACLIFFFIGAPLGAIIRKGGLGTPLVISVLLFIIYYIIDNTGLKMARDGKLDVWEGMWLSSGVLLPLGIFLTYKAVNDSQVLNADAYSNFFRKLIGKHEVRVIEMKEVVMEEVDTVIALDMIQSLHESCTRFIGSHVSRQHYPTYYLKGYPLSTTDSIATEAEHLVNYLSNSREKMIVLKLMDIPILRNLWVYHPGRIRPLGWILMIAFPIGIPLWLIGTNAQKALLNEYRTIIKTCDELSKMLKNDTNDNI